jgi:hypothetical protein
MLAGIWVTRRVLKDIGRNVPQEAPHAFAHAVVDVDRYRSGETKERTR